MATSTTSTDLNFAHPIELVTQFVVRQDWFLKQQRRDAIIAEIPGRWSHYQLAVSWQDDEETMQVICRIDVQADGSSISSAVCVCLYPTDKDEWRYNVADIELFNWLANYQQQRRTSTG